MVVEYFSRYSFKCERRCEAVFVADRDHHWEVIFNDSMGILSDPTTFLFTLKWMA